MVIIIMYRPRLFFCFTARSQFFGVLYTEEKTVGLFYSLDCWDGGCVVTVSCSPSGGSNLVKTLFKVRRGNKHTESGRKRI